MAPSFHVSAGPRRRLIGPAARQAAVVLVVALVSAGIVLVAGLGGETFARVDREVSVAWRPAYDVLVVPAGTELTHRVGGVRVSEANFMATLGGGISIRQWKSVLRLPGVEIAAPISTLGYFRRPMARYRIPVPPGLYRVNRTVLWDNGVEKRVQMRSAPPPVPPYTGQTRLPSVPKSYLALYRPEDVNDRADAQATLRDSRVSGFWVDDPSYEEDQEAWGPLGLDPGGVFSVYGIDPSQEAKLTGLDEAVGGEYFERVYGLGQSHVADAFCLGNGKCKPAHSLPLLLNRQGWTKTEFRIEHVRYGLTTPRPGALAAQAEPCPPDQEATLAGGTTCIPPNIRRLLEGSPGEPVSQTSMPVDDSRFGGIMELVDGRWVRSGSYEEVLDLPWLAQGSPIRYRPVESHPEGPWLGALEAIPTGSYGGEPTFRKQLLPPKSPLLSFDIVGTFDGKEIAERFSGRNDWLPEDTYRPPAPVLRYRLDGRKTPAAEFRPTVNPLGYLLQPPRALTTIDAAADLLGNRPISAIRVRVAGVGDATSESWTRVENVARSIAQETGLEPLVTLGASPARVLVKVPGVGADEQGPKQTWRLPHFVSTILQGGPRFLEAQPSRPVRGLGWVEEPWLRQGAAIAYLKAGAAQHSWLLVILLGSAVVYLIAAFTSLGLSEARDTAIRRAVGWTRRQVFVREVRRAGRLGAIGAVAGAGTGLLASSIGGLPTAPVLAFLAVPLGLVVCVAAALLPAYRVTQLPLAQILAGGEVALSGPRTRRGTHSASGIAGLALVQLMRLRARALLAVTAGVIATGSLLILVAVRSEFGETLQITLLGQAILLETGALQIGVTVVASVLAVALLGEILWQAVIDRRRDIGVLRAIGWARSQIAWLMMMQGMVLGLLCGSVGVVVSALILVPVFGPGSLQVLLPGAAAAATGGALLGILASVIPAYRAATEDPAGALRSV